MNLESLRDQIKDRCIHHNPQPGRLRKTNVCKAGVNYYDHMRIDQLGLHGCMLRLPCSGKKGETRGISVIPCDRYQVASEEEIAAKIALWEDAEHCMQQGISSCCRAPIDTSLVISEGRHKGHGPRYCSKCRKVVMMA